MAPTLGGVDLVANLYIRYCPHRPTGRVRPTGRSCAVLDIDTDAALGIVPPNPTRPPPVPEPCPAVDGLLRSGCGSHLCSWPRDNQSRIASPTAAAGIQHDRGRDHRRVRKPAALPRRMCGLRVDRRGIHAGSSLITARRLGDWNVLFDRRVAAEMTLGLENEILIAYGLTRESLIGVGTEARVFRMDPERVIKIYAGSRQQASNLKELKNFYDRLHWPAPSYQLPFIETLEISREGAIVVVERIIPGRPMAEVAELTVGEPHDLYLKATTALRQVVVDPPMGRLMLLPIGGAPADDWNALIRFFIDRCLADSGLILQRDVHNINNILGTLRDIFFGCYGGTYHVIHGDVFPGNLMMDESGAVTGLIDFGTLTMVGDPLFDLASASIYFDMYGQQRCDVRSRLLALAAAGLPTDDERRKLYAYVFVVAATTATLYPEPGIDVRQGGHYQWATDILNDPILWRSVEGK